MKLQTILLYTAFLLFIGSCSSYKQNIMFNTDDTFVAAQLSAEARALARTYSIQPNDRLTIKVYTKNGEMIIDPEHELNKDINQSPSSRPDPEYLVRLNGDVFLPMIGDVPLQGLTLHEANLKLTSLYNEYFIDPYVITEYTNKRVTVLGAPGGQILQLQNENLTVAEILAMSGGLERNGKSSGMKLIRGDQVFIIDFSTVEGYYAGNQIVQPGDIIYIQPIKRVLADNATSVALILSAITSLTTILVLFIR